MFTITTETFAHLQLEAQPLAAAHWNEVEAALHGVQRYILDQDRYATLEQLRMLHISAARAEHVFLSPAHSPEHAALAQEASAQESGALAGYAAFTLVACPHRPQMLLAALDGLYLAPWARGGHLALQLLRHAEAALANRGVNMVQYSSPVSRPCHGLYRRLGAHATETVWHKNIAPIADTCKEKR